MKHDSHQVSNLTPYLCMALTVLIGAFLCSLNLCLISNSYAYSIDTPLSKKGNHERSVSEVCKVAPSCIKEALIKGVREPDKQTLIPWEMGLQRVFSLDDHTRDVSSERAVIQHIHGNPLPMQVLDLKKAVKQGYTPIEFGSELPGNIKVMIGKSSRNDLWARVTMQQLRNKLLAQTASWLCVGLAHKSPRQRWRKFGNLAHMIGDTYSASHTLRLEQVNHPLLMSFSMDTVMWKKHIVGDANHTDFRFKALQDELKHLAILYETAAQSVNAQRKASEQVILEVLQQASEPIFDRLCEHTWPMDQNTLKRPAGGSTKDWSASMNSGQAMLPMGLSSLKDLSQYLKTLQKEDKDFFYTSRHSPDFCTHRQILRCDWQKEIKPAIEGSASVAKMFVPQVNRSY